VIKITDLLGPDCVRVPLRGTSKTAVITELVDLLHETGRIFDRNAVLRAVLAREEVRSTGLGEGLAVPHGKSEGCRSLTMAVGKPASPAEFESEDWRPCRLVVLLASPTDTTGPHIQALAGISRLWLQAEFRRVTGEAETAQELYAAFERLQS
jgi:mannitol/fructose-specific phosphotransferase system IIA component (Ntr-type)